MSRLTLMSAVCVLAIAACSGPKEETETVAPEAPVEETIVVEEPDTVAVEPGMEAGTLAWALAGDWRSEDEKARDSQRHPAETLEFFGLSGDETVVEIWPGGGWYSNILAPWLHANGGKLIAATFDPASSDRAAESIQAYDDFYSANPDLFGTIGYTVFTRTSGAMGEPDSVDAVLTFRNIHNWMAGDYADKFFTDAFAVLKPGGVLGVVEHRLPSGDDPDPSAPTGYVHEDYVKALAAAAGFEFVEASEINANPADTGDHPFGVWTLPPVSRTADGDGNAPADFDPAAYQAIGESDRMTLKFVKPAQ